MQLGGNIDRRFNGGVAGFLMVLLVLGMWLHYGIAAVAFPAFINAILTGVLTALVVHALPGSLHTESFDLEDLVRGLTFSSKIARDLGYDLPWDEVKETLHGPALARTRVVRAGPAGRFGRGAGR